MATSEKSGNECSRLMMGTMDKNVGTASAPVGEKQFCMSTIRRAERGGGETEGEEREEEEEVAMVMSGMM